MLVAIDRSGWSRCVVAGGRDRRNAQADLAIQIPASCFADLAAVHLSSLLLHGDRILLGRGKRLRV
jgi:hypothetical protein